MELKLKQSWKRIISFVLAFVMAFSFGPSITSRAAVASIAISYNTTNVTEGATVENYDVNAETTINGALHLAYDGKKIAEIQSDAIGVLNVKATGSIGGQVVFKLYDAAEDGNEVASSVSGVTIDTIVNDQNEEGSILHTDGKNMTIAYTGEGKPGAYYLAAESADGTVVSNRLPIVITGTAKVQDIAAADIKSATFGEAKTVVDEVQLVAKDGYDESALTGVTFTSDVTEQVGSNKAARLDEATGISADGKLTIKTTAATPAQANYNYTLSGTKDFYTIADAQNNVAFDVNAIQATIGDVTYSATVAKPSTGTVKVVDAQSIVVTDSKGNEVKELDTLTATVTNTPAGISATLSGDNSDKLTVTVSNEAQAGTYSVVLAATKANYTIENKTIQFTVTSGDAKSLKSEDPAVKVTMGNSALDAANSVVAVANSKTGDDAVYTYEPGATKTIGSFTFAQAGKFIRPSITVTYNDVPLVEGGDYEITGDFKKDTVGTYTLTIKGKNNYKDSLFVDWEIVSKNRAALEFDGASLWNVDENKAYESNKVYNGTSYIVASAKAAENDNPAITYEYFSEADILAVTTKEDSKQSDKEKALEALYGTAKKTKTTSAVTIFNTTSGTIAGGNYVANTMYKAITDAGVKKLDKTPVDAGNYVVFAKAAATTNYTETITGIVFTIDPLAVTVVPEKDAHKTYGDGAETIKFTAYTYYNETGKHTWAEYKNDAAATDVDETAGTMKYDGVTVNLKDVRPTVECTDVNGIDESGALFLTRADYLTASGENVGSYSIILNSGDGVDSNHVATLYKSAALGNEKFTIKKRDIAEAYARFLNDKNEEVTSLSYTNDGETKTPTYVVKDHIWVVNSKGDGFVQNNNVTLVKGTDYSVAGDESAYKGGDYTITVNALDSSNYTGTNDTLKWTISQSKNVGYAAVYGFTNTAIEDNYNEDENGVDIDYAKNGKYKVTYDGNPHGIQVKLSTILVDGSNTPIEWNATGSPAKDDKALVYYKNVSDTYNEITWSGNPAVPELAEVKADADWVTTEPKFTKAGVYTVEYKIVSQDNRYADVLGTFEITIEAMKVTSTAPTAMTNTYTDEDTVQAAIRANVNDAMKLAPVTTTSVVVTGASFIASLTFALIAACTVSSSV